MYPHDPVLNDNFQTVLARDFFSFICGGPLLGSGANRRVYACSFDPTLVIKVETGTDFSNIKEWNTWQDYKHDKRVAKWLAPCVAISDYGSVLIQKRAKPVRVSDLPRAVPAFLADRKIENWGLIDGKPVCVDYGWTESRLQMKSIRAQWWSLNDG